MKSWHTMNLRRRQKLVRELREQREAQAEAERIRSARLGWREWLKQLGSPFTPTAFHEEIWEYLQAQADRNSFCQMLKRGESYSPNRGFSLPARGRTGSHSFTMIVDGLDYPKGPE